MSITDFHASATTATLNIDSEERRRYWRQRIETTLLGATTAAAVLFVSFLSVINGLG